ncbi:MAG: AAA family ATPase [Candidatus Baltobacteraceae bacterium]
MAVAAITTRPFIGRSDELSHLVERRRAAGASRGGLVLVTGDAGLGKTRLLAEFAALLADARVRVTSSYCAEFAQRPYAPVLDLLERLDPRAAVLHSAPSRAEQFAPIVEGFRRQSERRTIVALVEDLHWTDPATIDLLAAVTREAANRRLLIVATYRPEAVGDDDPLTASVARLERLAATSTIELQPLNRPEMRALVSGVLDRSDALSPDVVARIADLSEGNPLFAEELLENALERARVGATGDALPASVRAAVLERARPLSEGDRNVLAQAAVIGRHFTLDLLEATLDAERDAILGSLQRARNLQLIFEEGEGAFGFRHALTREAIYDSFLDAQKSALHLRIARVLEAMPLTQRSTHYLAYHWYAAGDAVKAMLYGEAAGDAAMAVFSSGEAVRYFGYCRRFAGDSSAASGRVRMKLGNAYVRSGSWALAAQMFGEAIEILREIGDLEGECEATEELATALFGRGSGECCEPVLRLCERIAGLAEARNVLSRLHIFAAHVHSAMGRFDEASEALAAADVGAVADRPRSLTQYYATRASLAAAKADRVAYRAAMGEALALCPIESKAYLRAIVLSNTAQGLADLGALDEAEAALADAEAIARTGDFRQTLLYCTAMRASIGLLRGRLREARRCVEEALAAEADYERVRPIVAAVGAAAGLLLADQALVARCYDESFAVSANALVVAAAFAEHLVASGRTSDARELLRLVLDEPVSARNPFAAYVAIARFGDDADAGRAREVVAEVAGYEQDVVFKAALLLFDAIRAQRSGDAAAAAIYGAAAAAAFGRLGFPLWEAQALELAGKPDAASSLFFRAGAVQHVRRMNLQNKAQEWPRTLSPREREVASCIARGLSNAEIAAELSVSTKAVEKHLSSIYQKLGFSSRSKLLAYMARSGV